jgi:hypothetical protein
MSDMLNQASFPFKGVWIPAEVFSNRNISTNAKLLWAIVHILSNEHGCYASRMTLAGYLNCTDRNIQMLIGELVMAGLIKRDEKGVLWDIVTLAFDRGEENFTPGVKDSSPDPRRNLHPIDTRDTNDKTKIQAEEFEAIIKPWPKDLWNAWSDYVALRKQRKWTTSLSWQLKQAKYLSGFDPKAAIDALEVSGRNEWQSIHVKATSVAYRASKPAHTDADHSKGF